MSRCPSRRPPASATMPSSRRCALSLMRTSRGGAPGSTDSYASNSPRLKVSMRTGPVSHTVVVTSSVVDSATREPTVATV